MFLFFHIVPLYYIFAEYDDVRRNNIFYYNWSVFCRRSAESAVRQGQIQTNCQGGGGDSAGNFPSWGIKETNDLAEPELHMLVHHLAVKQGTNQRLAIMGHTRNSNHREDRSRSKLYQPLDQAAEHTCTI